MRFYFYDGSFEGFLTVVFEIYKQKSIPQKIQKLSCFQGAVFGKNIEVYTDEIKAARVWKGLAKKISSRSRNNLYKAFLSESPGVELLLFYYIQLSFNALNSIERNFGNEHVLRLHELSKKVQREIYRMQSSVHLEKTKDEIYYSPINSEFNVLPLLKEHFKNKYSDRQWLLFDSKRKYGIYYDRQKAEEVKIENSYWGEDIKISLEIFDQKDSLHQILSKECFSSIPVSERNNLSLSLKSVPKKNWNYLVDKE